MSDYRECVHIKSDCIHKNCKCSECPMCDLICDEFYDCIDSAIANAERETINGIMALIDKACESYDSLLHKSFDCFEKTEKEHLQAMHLQAIAYFEQRYNQYRYEFKNLIQNYANGERAEQLKEQTE